MGIIEFSQKKHQSQETKKEELILKCPYKFSSIEYTGDCDCIKENCAFWMPQQRACAINVNARIYGFIRFNKQP